ncbi:DUF1566 domain-containing protein [uncultured Desulfosarcina sp.]|uniref:Lcl C-terminal domain-containing protein n=1 Tax=uncultured Desulfosarcina sp. TaxID=218289 RepID=UPI0029C73CD2|nr:DUF1566 domain-containing protein [uncultured Desulfosarcina sp.]
MALILSLFLLSGCSGIGLRTENQESLETILASPAYWLPVQSFTKLDTSGQSLNKDAQTWSMVRDNTTGLIWEVKTEEKGIHYFKQKYDWQTAQTDFIGRLNQEKFGGYTDWRLPTAKELASIVDRTQFLPAIDTNYFPLTNTQNYWCAQTFAGDAAKVWTVHFCRGYVAPWDKTTPWFARAVHGPALPATNLVDNGDGTITDLTTGLMWQQKYKHSLTWSEALSYCENLKLAGHSDWRLPHVHELQTIIDYSRFNPSADGTLLAMKPLTGKNPAAIERAKLPIADPRLTFWSSTKYESSPERSIWVANFKKGSLARSVKTQSYAVRAVCRIDGRATMTNKTSFKVSE